jgi:hypothetical protein
VLGQLGQDRFGDGPGDGGGISAAYAAVPAALDTDIAAGSEDRVTDTVERVTGRPARGFREFAEAEIR